MKILYVITKSNWGGAQKYTYDMAVGATVRGHDVIVAAGGTGEKDAPPGLLAQKLEQVSIPFVYLSALTRNIFILNDIRAFFSLIGLYTKIKPDVVHVNSSKIGGLGALAARLTGIKKIVFTAHGFAIDESRPPLQKAAIAFLSWLTVLLTTDTIILTEKDVARITAWPLISDEKIHLVKNGIMPPLFFDTETARSKLIEILKEQIPPNALWVGSIGELHANKDFVTLIRAFGEFQATTENARLIIIGEGDERASIAAAIASHNLEDAVFLAGYVPDASRYLQAFDIFTLTSVKEGLPYVIIEAGFAKRAVIATKVGAIPELLGPVRGMLVAPGDFHSVAESLTYLAAHPEQRAGFGEALSALVNQEHHQEHMVNKTIALYNH